MMAAILFLVSTVAFVQFGLYYWRATISSVAARAISDRIRIACRTKARNSFRKNELNVSGSDLYHCSGHQ